MSLIQLVYVSTLVNEYGADLPHILRSIVRKNLVKPVNVMLLVSHGNVMQLLEGDPDQVRAVLMSIAKDSRHFGMTVLRDSPIEVACVEGLHAGLDVFGMQSCSGVQGVNCFKLKPDAVTQKVKPGFALTLLNEFASRMR